MKTRVGLVVILAVGVLASSASIVLSNKALSGQFEKAEGDHGAIMTKLGIVAANAPGPGAPETNETAKNISVTATYHFDPKPVSNKYRVAYRLVLINNGPYAEITPEYYTGSSATISNAQVLQNIRIAHALALSPSRVRGVTYPIAANSNPFGPNTQEQVLTITTSAIFSQTDVNRIEAGKGTVYIAGAILVSRVGRKQSLPFCWYSVGARLGECPIVW